jgi:hypothetical protein
MKWKLFVRNLSVSAPRVTVRSHTPWPLRALVGFVVLAVAAAAGVALYEYGRQFTGPDPRVLSAEIEKLQLQLREAKADRDRYAAVAAAYESQMKVERSSQEQLAQQVARLETESNRLREDLSFFESLLPTAGTPGKGVVIRSFRVQAEGATAAPGPSGVAEQREMRYRLLVQQSGKPDRDFVGSVQLLVSFQQGARNQTLQIPESGAAGVTQPLALSFRHYQRVEGTFTLPAGAVPKSVQVRILSDGQTQVQQSFII